MRHVHEFNFNIFRNIETGISRHAPNLVVEFDFIIRDYAVENRRSEWGAHNRRFKIISKIRDSADVVKMRMRWQYHFYFIFPVANCRNIRHSSGINKLFRINAYYILIVCVLNIIFKIWVINGFMELENIVLDPQRTMVLAIDVLKDFLKSANGFAFYDAKT